MMVFKSASYRRGKISNMASKGEKTRAEIVDCARKLFYEHGYDATSFTHIVDASGLFRGNIYHYFKTKDDILRAVVDRYREDYAAQLEQWDRKYGDPRMRLHAFVDMIVGRKSDLVKYGCPIGSLNTELGKEHRALQREARALFELFRTWLAARCRDLGHEADADSLALHLLGRAQGVAVISHIYQDKPLLEREAAGLKQWVDAL